MTRPRHTLLVLDDEERIRQLMVDYLEDFDEFAIRASGSAEDALADLAASGADLCIVDMRLPGLNGQEFIKLARERGLCGHYLLHTGSMDFRIAGPLESMGLTERDVFLKPCDMADLLERIREVLNGETN